MAKTNPTTKTITKKTATPPKKIATKKAVVAKPVTKIVAAKTPVKKTALILSDDKIDIEAFEKEVNGHIPLEKVKAKRSKALADLPTCPQGKQPKVIRDNCRLAPPIDKANYIVSLHVKLSTQTLTVTWLNGKVDTWLCSPNPKLTPRISDVVGNKCGAKHTNFKRDGMAWFTALKSKGMAYGFHNSQRVGLGIVSHGCIRVVCEHAKIINLNSWSGKTTIKIVR